MIRPATLEERHAIAQASCIDQYGGNYDNDELQQTLDQMAAAVVVEDYITDGPGYAGPVALVLYSADPGAIQSFTRAGAGWMPAVFE